MMDGPMEFHRRHGNLESDKLEKMYENLTNISNQLKLLQGFMENKYGPEFTSYCQLSSQSKSELEETYACPEGGRINEDGEEYDKMPNLVSEESPSRTLGYVSVPLRQSSEASRAATASAISEMSEAKTSEHALKVKCERHSDEGKSANSMSNAREDLMFPLHNFSDLLVGNSEEIPVHPTGTPTATTPEFMEMELDPTQLLRGEPPTLHPIFNDGLSDNNVTLHHHGQHPIKRPGSRHSGSMYNKYEMDVNNVSGSSANHSNHARVNNQRRNSVGVGSECSSLSLKKFDCLICGIQFEYAETLKSHMDSHSGCRSMRSSSDEQSGMEESTEEPQLPRLMPRPAQGPVAINYQESVVKSSSKSKKSQQTSSASSSSGSSSKSAAAKRRKRYNQSRPCSLECPECGLKIRDKSRLIEHLRGHTGERPYVCPYCDKSYTRKDVLKTHVLKMHGEIPFLQFPSSINDVVHNSSANSDIQQKNELTTSF